MLRDSVGAGRTPVGAGRRPEGEGDGGSPSQATVASAAIATIAAKNDRVNAQIEFIWQNDRQILLMVSASFRVWVS